MQVKTQMASSSSVGVFKMDSVMRDYHVYTKVWQSNTDDILCCRCKGANIHDPYAVCMVHESGIVVGHIPWTMSAVCELFICQRGTIFCQVTGENVFP